MKKKKLSLIQQIRNWCKGYDLDQMLEEISIMDCDDMVDSFQKEDKEYKLNTLLSGWVAVVDTQGINAYFSTEAEALRYRLELINRTLNG